MFKKIVLGLLVLYVSACTSEQDPLADEEQKVMAKFPPISVQLWSIKDEIKQDFSASIQALSNMGFDAVEFAEEFGPFQNDPKGLKAFLGEQGLAVSGAHVPFEKFNNENFEETVSFYNTLGAEYLVIPWDERAWNAEQVPELVAELNALAKKLKPFGLKAGFHNHDQEFNSFQSETYWDYIAKNTSEDVILQLDVAWVKYAGKDPVAYVNRYPGRTLTTHFKVRTPPEMENEVSPFVGDDIIDWNGLIKSCMNAGGTSWFVVEQEEYPGGISQLEAVRKSKQGLDKLLNAFPE